MNLVLLFFSIFFYLQNFFISFFINFVFVPTLLEFLAVFIIVLFLARFKYFKLYMILWQVLYLIHFSFIAYFGKTITYIDIYLFFTHIDETFESLFAMVDTVMIPLYFTIGIVFVLLFMKFKKNNINSYILIFIFLFSFSFLPKLHDGSFLLLKETASIYKIDNNVLIQQTQSQLEPIRKEDLNIVLVLGESMRAREYLQEKISFFENNIYKTIYAGATNTDVAVPLLLNGALRPKEIDLQKNLFRLAKTNGFTTHFISAQNHTYLQYIKPYLGLDYIANIQIIKSQDDMDLVKELKKVDLAKNNFLVLQMQGQHSPYKFYPSYKKEDSLLQRYNHSMRYSDKVLKDIVKYFEGSNKRYVFVFSADHGEHIGLNGKFGHNSFDKEIYKVPFVYKGFDQINKEFINHHNDIYRLVYYYLGYSKEFHANQESLKIYGTMINEEDGFIDIP